MTCSHPIDAARLADYWLAMLPQPEEDALEEHLLCCDQCGARLREAISLAQGIRALAREGSLLMIVSDAFLQRAAEQGLRVREYAPPRSGSIECTVTAGDDLLVGRLNADFSGANRVDLSLCDDRGVERIRLPDVPFSQGASSVVFQQPIGYAKAAASETMIARLVIPDDSGVERLLGEYTFHHTRTLPGSGMEH